MIQRLIEDSQNKKVLSVDVPSGWEIDGSSENSWQPTGLVSLSAPKECSKNISNTCLHYLGGRFIPDDLAEEFNIEWFMQQYKGSDLITRL